MNACCSLSDALKNAFPWCEEWERELKKLFRGYVEAKQHDNVLDYDDLLLYWAHMMAEPALARLVGERFDHVLVDEYQDTNALQAQILLGMRPDGRGLTVVGDDAQSIYSFRAATVRNILDFPKRFTPPAHVVTLERNYRSTTYSTCAASSAATTSCGRSSDGLVEMCCLRNPSAASAITALHASRIGVVER